MILSQNATNLIKYILTFTGEKEINPKGQEVDSQRRLGGEDSSQRRHFLKAVNPLLEEKQKKLKEIQDEANKVLEAGKEEYKKENPKKKSEEQSAYDAKMNRALNKKLKDKIEDFNKQAKVVNDEKIEFELTPKTIETVKKYMSDFETKVGWMVGDEDFVEEINQALK